jgi:hypothetical protein
MNKIANIVNCQQQKSRKSFTKMMERAKLTIFVTKQYITRKEFSSEEMFICAKMNLSFSVGYFWWNKKYLLQYFKPQRCK